MDLNFKVFLGGSASLADNFDFVGKWGQEFTVFGKQTSTVQGRETTLVDSGTRISSSAMLTLRWWVIGI